MHVYVCMYTVRCVLACFGRGVIACATGWRVILSASGWVDLASRRVERQQWRLAPPVLAPARVSWGVDGVILPDGSDLDSGHLTHSGVQL